MKKYIFICIKDVFMNPTGTHAYVKGKVYYGQKFGDSFYLNDEQTDYFSHGAPIDFLEEYFKPKFTYGK